MEIAEKNLKAKEIAVLASFVSKKPRWQRLMFVWNLAMCVRTACTLTVTVNQLRTRVLEKFRHCYHLPSDL